jgi:hypothetical protein
MAKPAAAKDSNKPIRYSILPFTPAGLVAAIVFTISAASWLQPP